MQQVNIINMITNKYEPQQKHRLGTVSKTRGPWATTLIWMYSYERYIQPKYCKRCMQER